MSTDETDGSGGFVGRRSIWLDDLDGGGLRRLASGNMVLIGDPWQLIKGEGA